MKYKLLIVEDDKDTANVEVMTFKKLGFISEAVYNGDEALPKMKEMKPDVVILDLELPGKNGLQILQQMFLDPELRNLIIIANTVHMDAKDDLGFAFYAHYQRTKNQEPVMINKLQTDEDMQFDLPTAVAEMMGQKFGVIPAPLAEWLKTKGKWDSRWQIA